jgi:pimeloyl-ACP methyl ester carboxylesterase
MRTRILRRWRRRDRWSGLPVRSTLTEVGPHRVHSVELGQGEEQVILIHGLAGSAVWWRRNVRTLCSHYRVLIPDLIGFGKTRRAGRLPNLPGVATVLREWMGALELDHAHVVGHSMGGQVALHLTAGYPACIHRLVLVDSAGIPRPLTPVEVGRFALAMAPPSTWGDPRFLSTIVSDALTAGPRTLAHALWHIVGDDVGPLLPRIRVPTLIVWGENDRLVPLWHATEFRERIPGARLAVIPGAAHNPMVDRPSEFNDVVLRFLRGEAVGR